jgi:hypothetical protein
MTSEQRETSEEYELMLAGKPYLASDPYIQQVHETAAIKVKEINSEHDGAKRQQLLRAFFTCAPDADVFVTLPFFCEYVSRLWI